MEFSGTGKRFSSLFNLRKTGPPPEASGRGCACSGGLCPVPGVRGLPRGLSGGIA